jgi:hypothetical protein
VRGISSRNSLPASSSPNYNLNLNLDTSHFAHFRNSRKSKDGLKLNMVLVPCDVRTVLKAT